MARVGSQAGTTWASSSTVFWTVATIVAYLAMVGVNALANLLPIAGRETGDISANYPVLITPAPFTFSIWGVIYLALAVFVVYQALPAQRTSRLDRSRQLFVLSCALNVSWLLAWHYLLIPLSQLIMFGLLVTLIAIYRHLRLNPALASGTDKWIPRTAFSLYLGWISVATLANLGVLLYAIGPLQSSGWDLAWALLGLATLTLTSLWILGMRRDVVFAAVAVWATVGILVANLSSAVLTVAAAAAALLVLLGAIRALFAPRETELIA